MNKWLFSISAFLFSFCTSAQDGSLDTTFGVGGKVTTSFTPSADEGYGMAIQPDGKIMVVGMSHNGVNKDIAVSRYNVDGSLDTNFNGDGKVITAIGTQSEVAHAVAVQPDGKIIVAGRAYNSGFMNFALVRYNSDGSLDPSFGIGGIVLTDADVSDDELLAIALQSDGKIVVSGIVKLGGNYHSALARYTSDGSLDISFGISGLVIFSPGTVQDQANSLTIQVDGKILIGGVAFDGTYSKYYVARFDTNGVFDNSFNFSGLVYTDFSIFGNAAYSVVVQQDGKILASGSSENGTDGDFSICRYNSDGTLDTSFSGDGKVMINLGGADSGSGLLIQTDGKIIQTGWAIIGGFVDFTVIRYLTNGSLDATFDGDGIVSTDFGGSYVASTSALQADNKIVLAGYFLDFFDSDFALARYNACSVSYYSVSQTACDSFNWNGSTYSISGTYYDTLLNAIGCDSILTLNLIINTVVDDSLIVNDPTITANVSSASYQWLDCLLGFSAISGETFQSFTATSNGEYAVIITQGGCVDTSACTTILGVGTNNINVDQMTLAYPNPATSYIELESNFNSNHNLKFFIYDNAGNIVCFKVIQDLNRQIIEFDLESGIYIIRIMDEETKLHKFFKLLVHHTGENE